MFSSMSENYFGNHIKQNVVGQIMQFSVIPVNPGAIHASVQRCSVENERGTQSHVLIGQDENGQTCRDWVTEFQMTSTGGWSDNNKLDFAYRAFKWTANMGSKSSEKQILKCRLKLGIQYNCLFGLYVTKRAVNSF